MKKSPLVNKSMGIHDLGYVGNAMWDVWTHKHCSMKSENETFAKDCMKCFKDNEGKQNETIECSRTYLPEEYEKCWVGTKIFLIIFREAYKEIFDIQVEKEKYEFEDWIKVLKCFGRKMKEFDLKTCIDKGPKDMKSGINEISHMNYAKYCMERARREFQVSRISTQFCI